MAIPITQGQFRGPRPLSPQGNAAIQTMQAQLGGQNSPRPNVMQTMAPQTAMQPQNTQQYGLAGAESAYNQALSGAGQALQQGTGQALGTLQGGYQSALSQLGQGQQALGGNFGSSAANVDPMTGQPMFQQAAQGVGQFAGAGLSAQQRQAALSGALGQEAQQQAYQQFNASPGQQYLQEQGMRQVLNANTATGGLGGGNVLQELQRQGMGLAQQDYQNQFNNLGSLSNQGLQAAGQQGQFLSQAGQQQGQLAGQNAQMQTQVGMANANNALGAANSRANLFEQGANIAGQLASQGAGYQASQGTNIANLLSGTGSNIAQGRMQAGRDIAGNVSNVSGALGNLANQQGQGLSDIVGQGGVNVSNLLQGYGNMTAQQQQQLANTLANMAVGQGTQQAGITQNTGQAQAAGALQQGQIGQNLLGNLSQLGGYYAGAQAPAAAAPPQQNWISNSQFAANNRGVGF